MDTSPPVVVGLPTRLRLVELLSAGSTATVWRARDRRDGVDVAVKLVAPRPGVDPQLQLERSEREGRSLARLRGVPGVLALRELGVAADGTTWLVSELAPGGSLATLTAPVDPAWARGEARRTATALAAAHGRSVVHGDLSPANVLLDAAGRAVLADFGMAQLRDGGADGVGVAGCTPAFAAPERLAGAPPDGPSDVYALCATWTSVLADAVDAVDQVGAVGVAAAIDAMRSVLAAGTAVDPSSRPRADGLAQRLAALDRSS